MPDNQAIPWRRVSVEAAAIVASILLAFAIQAWWEQRNETDLEQRILSALLKEFEQNDRLLQDASELYEGGYTIALDTFKYLDRDTAEFDEAQFGLLIRGLLSGRTIHLESGAHDALLASGELSIIRDETLRNRLAAWPSYVAEWSEEEAAVFSFNQEILTPSLSSYVRLRNIRDVFAPFPAGNSPAAIPGGSSEAGSLSVLAGSLEFDNLVHRRAQGLWYAMRDGETLRVQLAEILDLIRQNLDE